MKMVMVVYNEAIDLEVMEAMECLGLKNYTKVMGAFGRGEASGTHLGNDVWPGKNNILYVACSGEQSRQLGARIAELRKTIGAEGVKAFVMPLEEAN